MRLALKLRQVQARPRHGHADSMASHQHLFGALTANNFTHGFPSRGAWASPFRDRLRVFN